MKKPISVVMVVKDEEPTIGKALQSVLWADEIIVMVDDRSQDQTYVRAKRYTRHVFLQKWLGFVATKKLALAKTRHDWVLWLDGDEVISPELQAEIQGLAFAEEADVVGYRVPRRSFFMGRWMKFSWSPKRDQPLRLFNKKRVFFKKDRVHEHLQPRGNVKALKYLIDHYTFKGMPAHIKRIHEYSRLAALQMKEEGRRFSPTRLLTAPLYAFLLSYLKRQGFRDGLRGFVLCAFYTYNTFLDWLWLWEFQQEPGPTTPR